MRTDGVQLDLGGSIAGPETTRVIRVNLVTSESPAAWPRDVRFTVHASIGMIAGKCNLIRHLSSILATRTSVVFELMTIRIGPKGQELHEI